MCENTSQLKRIPPAITMTRSLIHTLALLYLPLSAISPVLCSQETFKVRWYHLKEK